jgi:hypothetical protein
MRAMLLLLSLAGAFLALYLNPAFAGPPSKPPRKLSEAEKAEHRLFDGTWRLTGANSLVSG